MFDEEGALDRFEGFASLHGPAFYGLPVNDRCIRLVRKPNAVPAHITAGEQAIVHYHSGESIAWHFAGLID